MRLVRFPANALWLLGIWALFPQRSLTQDQGLVAWWKFDEGKGRQALDNVGHVQDKVLNNYEWVGGVSSSALKFDGFTTVVTREAQRVPRIEGNFSIEAWVAIQAYPWNWVAIVDQEKDQQAGYFFGIDSEGRLGLQLAVWGSWEECTSEVRVPLREWSHVAGTYDPASGIRLYVNGKSAGKLPVLGKITPAEDTGLQIGRSFKMLPPTALVREFVKFPASYSLDGILDELKIYNRTLSPEEVASAYTANKSAAPLALAARAWPPIPEGPKRFRAAYCQLKLYPEWDALWRTGPYSDVVVRFEDEPYKYVFWRGTNFEENLVTENGIWVGDQSFESGTRYGCAEHMSDKKNLHNYITVIENTDARVVLHWRYGLVDVVGNFSNVDPLTGWGDWADEYFYIYPDGVAVRHGTIHGTDEGYSFTEPTLLLEPGKKAEDYISLDAATIANMKGESRTYSWDPTCPPYPFPDQPAGANIAELNLKSIYKPFFIYQPGTMLGPYGNPHEARLEYSRFPTWNHWPVSQAPSDGRYALFPDRFASAAIMSPDPNKAWVEGPGSTKSTYFLFGLTKQPAGELATLARSWLQAPKLKIFGKSFTSEGYVTAQRAYVLEHGQEAKRSVLDFEIEASDDSPVVNPAFVIKGWGDVGATLKINGKAIARGKDFRWGHVYRLEGSDLVVWLRQESSRPVRVSLTPSRD
jgi:hypothetical protein